MKQPLNLETLGNLDGGTVRALIDSAISRAVEDVDDRGDDNQPRKVVIEIELKKPKGSDFVATQVKIQAKIPVYKSHSTVAETAQKSGKILLLFNDMAPDNPKQRTIDEVDNE